MEAIRPAQFSISFCGEGMDMTVNLLAPASTVRQQRIHEKEQAMANRTSQETSQNHHHVIDFIRTHLEYTRDKKHFLSRAELYAAYKEATPNERDNKLYMGKRRFFDIIKEVLGESSHKENFSHNNIRVRDAFVGWRWKIEEASSHLGPPPLSYE